MDLGRTQVWSYTAGLPEGISAIRELLEVYSNIAVESVDEHLLHIVSAKSPSFKSLISACPCADMGVRPNYLLAGRSLGMRQISMHRPLEVPEPQRSS